MNKSSGRELRSQIVEFGKSVFDRGLTGGSTGNISVRTGDRFLMTPTGSSLGRLDADRLTLLDAAGNHLDGDSPTKESVLHLAMYGRRPDAQAVIHLHSTHAVAVSCLDDIDPADVLPPITAYYVMRVGVLPLVPFYPPGDGGLAHAVGRLAAEHHAVLLAHHGPVVAANSLAAAVDAVEELEETARLYLLLRGHGYNTLTDDQVRQLRSQ
ncbi:MAG: aldolase [Chloroflexi bacterium]|nr:aldolase [Chloroflexota bacterium]